MKNWKTICIPQGKVLKKLSHWPQYWKQAIVSAQELYKFQVMHNLTEKPEKNIKFEAPLHRRITLSGLLLNPPPFPDVSLWMEDPLQAERVRSAKGHVLAALTHDFGRASPAVSFLEQKCLQQRCAASCHAEETLKPFKWEMSNTCWTMGETASHTHAQRAACESWENPPSETVNHHHYQFAHDGWWRLWSGCVLMC